ncbi:glycosyltransferase [Aestuariimicrobium sp. T2.26MG-19.2B]|uniref:glycosyltransferase n=1 Tax=Aestuariimicrobium sp. T2.26MG-19.2B TaxID=3040679 RepID=UPI002477738E|nr:glycosyltransferase [Aestuariimicrobium sp. T2.26MG-19.2B]CAI9403973.1 D-inositol-3-phosphate glycosyltransferase [Aestuariimicrobium sp. T2.26MG-19.2B]
MFVSMHTSPVATPGSGDAGGMNVVEWNIATALARQGHDVTLVTRKSSPDDADSTEVGPEGAPGRITLVTLPAGPLAPLAKSEIDAHIDEFRAGLAGLEAPGIVHSHHWMSGVAALDVARGWRVPHVQSFHSVAALPGSPLSSGEPPESPARVPGERVTAQTSDAVVAISAAEAGTVVQRCGANPDRVHIVAPGVDRTQFFPRPGGVVGPDRDDPGYAVFAARLQPLKGPDLAMRALAHVEKWLRPRLVIAGDYSADFADYGRDLAALVGRLGLSEEVEFVGGQDRESLAELIRGARLMLVPSHSETFGLIALEAAASGVPVIAAAAGGLREAVVHGETGQLMDSRDPAEWGKAITHVLTTPGLHERMSVVAPIHARRFDWNHTATALVELYESLTSRAHAHPTSTQESSVTHPLLDDVRRVAIVHAHPDDETIATGALIAHLRERGVEVRVLTATRGERGEIVPGTFDVSDADALHHADALDAERERELARALATLGVERAEFLGQGSARVAGLQERGYSDSGMRWVTPSVAGPALDSPDHAFSLSPVDEVAGDIAAWLESVRPDLVITYDELGGYGHPDHVRAREAVEIATRRLRLPLAEVFQAGHSERFGEGSVGEGVEWLDLTDKLGVVKRALGQHRTQLTVDGDDIVHVGGQREPITVRVGLREV